MVATGKWRKGVGSRRLRSGFQAPDQGCIGPSVSPGGGSEGSRKGSQGPGTP